MARGLLLCLRTTDKSQILAGRFEITDGEPIEIRVKISGKNLDVDVNGNKFSLTHPEIPDQFHLGFTACEGICRISEFCVEEH